MMMLVVLFFSWSSRSGMFSRPLSVLYYCTFCSSIRPGIRSRSVRMHGISSRMYFCDYYLLDCSEYVKVNRIRETLARLKTAFKLISTYVATKDHSFLSAYWKDYNMRNVEKKQLYTFFQARGEPIC